MKKMIIQILIVSLLVLHCNISQAQESHKQKKNVTKTTVQLTYDVSQKKSYNIVDKKAVLQAVIATLNEYGFIIYSASLEHGFVNSVYRNEYNLSMNVNVYPTPNKKNQITVLANAMLSMKNQVKPKEYPDFYKTFFDALSKKLLLK